MAKDAKAAAATAEQPAAPKKGKKLLILALAAVLLLVLGAGGTFVLLKKGDEADDEDAAETSHAKKPKKGKESHPTFVNLEPFTVNLVPETGDQYLQVALSVEFDEPTAEQTVKLHMPKIRNNVTLLLSGKKPSELLTKEGKEKLAAELLDTINEVLDPPKRKGERSEDRPAKAVLFTSFIIQ
jgi:flagellar FliL protein